MRPNGVRLRPLLSALNFVAVGASELGQASAVAGGESGMPIEPVKEFDWGPEEWPQAVKTKPSARPPIFS